MRLKHHTAHVSWVMLSVLFIFLTAQPAYSKVYKWIDDQGRNHFTDSENNIPVKYRTKDKVKRVKGMTAEGETKSEAKVPAGEDVSGGSEQVEATPEGGAGVEGGAGASEADSETVALLQEAKSFLEDQNERYKKMIEFVPADEKNGKNMVYPLLKSAPKKKEMAGKMANSGLSVLKPLANALNISSVLDSQETVGGPGYGDRLVSLKARIESEVFQSENMIKILEDEIAKLK